MAEVSRLPAAAQAQREQLKAAEAAGGNPPPQNNDVPNDPSNNDPQKNNESPKSGDGTRVTLSKEEFNELQADRDRVRAAERRAEGLEGDLQAVRQRLTELEAAAKGGGRPESGAAPAPAQAAWDATQIPLTDKEKADFEEDTVALMEKVALNVFRREAANLLGVVEQRIAKVESLATDAATTVGKVRTNTFTDKVREEVSKFGGNFDQMVSHKHWQAFTQSEDDNTGFTYAELLRNNVETQRLSPVVKVFQKFYDKYIKDAPNTDGYSGALPSGTASELPQGGNSKPEILKYSDRKALQKKYLNHEIKYEEYEIERQKFEIADREGRLDYES